MKPMLDASHNHRAAYCDSYGHKNINNVRCLLSRGPKRLQVLQWESTLRLDNKRIPQVPKKMIAK